MREVDVPLTRLVGTCDAQRAVEQVCTESGLVIGLRGALARDPGSFHWHLKRAGETGTLEVSFAPTMNRLWLKVHARREATWTIVAMNELATRLAQLLQTD